MSEPLERWQVENLSNHWKLLNELGKLGKLPPDYGRQAEKRETTA